MEVKTYLYYISIKNRGGGGGFSGNTLASHLYSRVFDSRALTCMWYSWQQTCRLFTLQKSLPTTLHGLPLPKNCPYFQYVGSTVKTKTKFKKKKNMCQYVYSKIYCLTSHTTARVILGQVCNIPHMGVELTTLRGGCQVIRWQINHSATETSVIHKETATQRHCQN